MLTRVRRKNLWILPRSVKLTQEYLHIIIATTEHYFDTTYSLSIGRLRVKLTLVYCDFPPLIACGRVR